MNRNKIITLVILSIAIIVGLYLVYVAKNKNVEAPAVIQSTATSSETVVTESIKQKERFVTGGLTITDLPTGWEIRNRVGNILQVKQGAGTVMGLRQAAGDNLKGEPNPNVNFEDLDLVFTGEVTVNVTADHSREDTLTNTIGFEDPYYGPVYYPVTISSSTLSKLPSVPSDTRTPKFCVGNERISHDVHKNMYDTETEFVFNIYVIGSPNGDPEQSCTHLLISTK